MEKLNSFPFVWTAHSYLHNYNNAFFIVEEYSYFLNIPILLYVNIPILTMEI